MIGISGYGNSPLTGYIYGSYAGVSNAGSADGGQNVGAIKNPGESTKVSPGRKSSPAECQTCKERKYQDGSDENVSFKSAQHISPTEAGARVRAHEQEHVANAYSKAEEKGGKVINASVSIHTAICPECGRTYVSGGLTRTSIKYPNENNPYQKNKKANDGLGMKGQSVDMAI